MFSPRTWIVAAILYSAGASVMAQTKTILSDSQISHALHAAMQIEIENANLALEGVMYFGR